MKRVALTGGTGFVGANLARRLLRDGHIVHLLVRPGYAAWRIEEIANDVRLNAVDLTNARNVSDVIEGIRPEWVFHLATHGAYSWQTDIGPIFQTNIIGTVNVVEACLKTGCESLVHSGSSSEYGFKDHAPAETEWLEPNSHYALAKASATQYCRYAAQAHDANITTLRLYSVFGPYEDPNRLMPTLIRHGLCGEWPPLADPDTARDYVYVDDVCDACVLAAQAVPGERGVIYNVGSGKQTTLREIVNVARSVFGIRAEPPWGTMAARRWDTSVWRSDSRKIERALGWQPRYSLEEGFLRTVEWYRTH